MNHEDVDSLVRILGTYMSFLQRQYVILSASWVSCFL